MDETLFLQETARKFVRVSIRSTGEDHRLLERVASGERRALEEIYTRHGRELFRYLHTLTPDRQVAEEILQDTLVAVWRGAGTYKGRSSPRTWLFGVARRQAHNALRKHRLPVAERGTDEPAARDVEPEEVLLAKARIEELVDRLRALSPLHREVLALVFFHELSYEETAQILGVPIGTVKSRISNARRALRERSLEVE